MSLSGNACEKSTESQHHTRLIRFVHALYDKWAHFIVTYSYVCIFACTLLTISCTIKVLSTSQRNLLTQWTPYGSRSLVEFAVKENFFDNEEPPITMMLLIESRERNGNVLTLKNLREIVNIDDIIRHNFTIFNRLHGKQETFNEFCTNFCSLNDPIRSFYSALQLRKINERNVYLGYPNFNLFGVRINIQPNVFGVQLKHNQMTNRTELVGADLVVLTYKAGIHGAWDSKDVEVYETKVLEYFQREYHSEDLRLMVLNPTYVQGEIIRSGFMMIPAIFLGFGIMCIASISTVLLSASYFQQLNIHKVSLALITVMSPLMASVTALGLLFFAGLRFSSVLCITPFLILAIGIDDSYVIIHAWSRVSKELKKKSIAEDSVEYRLKLVLIESGPAVLISALTNLLADGVGSLTGSEEITILCVGSMASIVVDFFYQMTLFASVMAIAGKLEIEQDQKKSVAIVQPTTFSTTIGVEHKTSAAYQLEFTKIAKRSFHDKLESGFQSFVVFYIKLITNKVASIVIFALWISFVSFSIYWTMRFKILLSFDKMVVKDSPLLAINNIREDKILPNYTVATIFVEEPGDLFEPSRLRQFNRMVDELETIPESWGPNSTFLFTRDFLRFEQTIKATEELDEDLQKPTIDDLRVFLEWPEYNFWKGFVKLRRGENATFLDSFFFQVAYHDNKLRSSYERGGLLERWRRVVDRYPEFKASVYNDEAIFLDLVDNMPTDCWQSCVGTLICVGFVCLLFMNNTLTVFIATAIVGSVMIGMLGMLSWQAISLDPVVLASVLISIGFSIDIPTHIVYHTFAGTTNATAKIQDRLISALSSVGFPAIQASLSTSLVIIALLFVPLYVAHVFVRVMYLCIFLCLIHSLFIFPALFTAILKLTQLS
ncbi:Patched domain-containing protein 3 [Aphelenchoides besseyi]|nr:Patched domain-containing protein 3 [Aphelenchoides besseyi]KAI6199237.1 Patched domain-containing protein 3 [Aphelenchoides besseyi]